MNKDKILKKIDRLTCYDEKVSYLNELFLKASTGKDELMILDMVEQLRKWGK